MRGLRAWPLRAGLSSAGFSFPCSFVAAVSGANGSILWERPAAQDGALVLCGVPHPRDSGASSACVLVGRSGSFIAVDLFTGRLVPSALHLGLRRRTMPARSGEGQPVLWGM